MPSRSERQAAAILAAVYTGLFAGYGAAGQHAAATQTAATSTATPAFDETALVQGIQRGMGVGFVNLNQDFQGIRKDFHDGLAEVVRQIGQLGEKVDNAAFGGAAGEGSALMQRLLAGQTQIEQQVAAANQGVQNLTTKVGEATTNVTTLTTTVEGLGNQVTALTSRVIQLEERPPGSAPTRTEPDPPGDNPDEAWFNLAREAAAEFGMDVEDRDKRVLVMFRTRTRGRARQWAARKRLFTEGGGRGQYRDYDQAAWQVANGELGLDEAINQARQNRQPPANPGPTEVVPGETSADAYGAARVELETLATDLGYTPELAGESVYNFRIHQGTLQLASLEGLERSSLLGTIRADLAAAVRNLTPEGGK